MRWLLRPPLVLGWFESLPYRLGNVGGDVEKRRAERLKYWDPDSGVRSPKAQLYGFLTGSIIWVAVTFVVAVPLLGWLIGKGAPVPGFVFGFLALLPVAMLAYIGVLLSFAPIKTTSTAWIIALSWPIEAIAMLLVGLVSWSWFV